MFWFGAEGDAQEKGEFNENFQLFTIVQTSARPTRVFFGCYSKVSKPKANSSFYFSFNKKFVFCFIFLSSGLAFALCAWFVL
jgi:hypothetical protein